MQKLESGYLKLYLVRLLILPENYMPIKIGHTRNWDVVDRFWSSEHTKLVRVEFSAKGKAECVCAVEESFKRRYPRTYHRLTHNFSGISELLTDQNDNDIQRLYRDPLYALRREWEKDFSYLPDYVVEDDMRRGHYMANLP